MSDSRYKKYKDCNLQELEQIVEDLENMSIAALKSKKIPIRKSILDAVKEAKLVIEKRLKK
jgi:ribosomal protein L15|tara:strand:+ start:822 stop:1004 length:183 start_codon:yes stop_codon:yes gene_type:complete